MKLYLCDGMTRREDTYTLLAYAARQQWDLHPLPAIARHEQGKPFFPAFGQYHFNLSHSGPFSLCALDKHPVGVDIEVIRPHHPKLAQRICCGDEQAWLEAQPDKAPALCQLWTRKEALAKYHGTGLTVPLRELRVPLPPATMQNGLKFYSIATPEFCLCVCGHTAVHDVISVSREEIFR